MQKELVLKFKELNLVGIVCRTCGTELLFDLSRKPDETVNFKVPGKCSACEQYYSDEVDRFVDTLRQLYPSLAGVHVHVKMPE